MSTQDAAAAEKRSLPIPRPRGRIQLQEYALVAVVAMILIVGAILEPDSFLTSDNMLNVLRQASVVGVLAIQSSLKGPATVALALPMALLVIPILDTTAAIVRRKLTGRSIYCTDRAHLHHCLQGRGFSDRRVLLLVASLCLVTGLGALASLAANNEWLAVLSAGLVVGVLVTCRLFGHADAADMRLTLVKGADHRMSTPEDLALLARTIEDIL